MPKFAKSIIDISDGINSDSSAQVISDNSVHDAVNINIDRIGRIKPTNGFENNGSYANAGRILSFRTDNNSNSPKEFLVMQDGANNMYARDSVSLASDATIYNNPGFRAGFNYSNGVLLAYPKDLDAPPKVYLAEQQFNTGWELDYDGLKAPNALYLNGVFNSGNQFAAVAVFYLTTDVTETTAEFAQCVLDVKGRSFSPGGNIWVTYNDIQYTLTIPDSPNDVDFGTNLASIINSSDMPMSATYDSVGKFVELTSALEGSDGNGSITFFSNDSFTSFYAEDFTGGIDSEFEADNIDKVLPAGTYKFSSSVVFWDGSESNPSGTESSITFEEKTKFSVVIAASNSLFTSLYPFIKKLKMYVSSESFETSLLAEYDYNRTGGKWKFYNETDFTTDSPTSHSIDLTLPLRSSFSFETGYSIEERAVPRMRKFLIVNNRGYAFNVSYGNDYYQDRMIISPQGKPYLLPENNKIDVVTEDGDEYVTAEHYGSFIYAFKNYTLYVINIASNDPSSFFLADSIYGVGVNDEKSVTKTEFGIFWANKNGIYTHNGERIQNLTFNKIEDEWRGNASDDISCGYDIINKKIVFNRGDTTYIYDMKLSSFSKLKVLSTGTKSNFFVRDDKLSVFEGSQLKTLTLGNSSTAWSLTTKSYTLDKVAVRKKIRRFYVTFKDKSVNLSNVTFEYSLDNTGDWTTITDKEFINDDDGVAKDTVARFNLPRSITAYSVQLRISSSSVMSEIEDITIIYRAKHPK